MNLERRHELTPLPEILSFKEKTVLVTGSGSAGIGRAIANRFDEGGANLILLDINLDGLKETVLGLKRSDFHSFYRVDLSSKNEIDNFWSDIKTLPDILINNAGVYPEQDFCTLSKESFDKTFRINFESALWMSQNFIKLRGKNGGTIVNVSSIEAILPFKKDMIPYSVSKEGIIPLTRGLASEYGDHFKINAVLPGAIDTSGTRSMAIKALKNLRFDLITTGITFSQRLPKGRWGKADEVAKAVLFLSSDLSSYVQGAVIPVDGGFLSN